MAPTPLQIATQEYAYWRRFDLKDSTDKAPEMFTAVLVGAIGAAANITSRLAGHDFEGIDYETLSPEQITALLMEIRLAPRLARVLDRMAYQYRELLKQTLHADSSPSLDEAGALLSELKNAGVLSVVEYAAEPRERKG